MQHKNQTHLLSSWAQISCHQHRFHRPFPQTRPVENEGDGVRPTWSTFQEALGFLTDGLVSIYFSTVSSLCPFPKLLLPTSAFTLGGFCVAMQTLTLRHFSSRIGSSSEGSVFVSPKTEAEGQCEQPHIIHSSEMNTLSVLHFWRQLSSIPSRRISLYLNFWRLSKLTRSHSHGITIDLLHLADPVTTEWSAHSGDS